MLCGLRRCYLLSLDYFLRDHFKIYKMKLRLYSIFILKLFDKHRKILSNISSIDNSIDHITAQQPLLFLLDVCTYILDWMDWPKELRIVFQYDHSNSTGFQSISNSILQSSCLSSKFYRIFSIRFYYFIISSLVNFETTLIFGE